MVLAQLGQALDRSFLKGQAGLADFFGLKPVEVVGQIDQRIGAGLIQQVSQAGGVPAAFRRTWREEANIFFGTEADQRLSQGIAAAQ